MITKYQISTLYKDAPMFPVEAYKLIAAGAVKIHDHKKVVKYKLLLSEQQPTVTPAPTQHQQQP